MTLKDFVKAVLSDITNAIKESQQELDNGAIISPTNSKYEEKIKSVSGDVKVSYIDFEVSVTTTSSVETNDINKSGVEVKASVLGVGLGGKLGNKSTNEGNKLENENLSKIRFSIPIVYPVVNVQERVSRLKANVGHYE